MFGSKRNLTKEIERLHNEGYHRELRIAGLQDTIQRQIDHIKNLENKNIKLMEEKQDLFEKNTHLLRENVELLQQMRKSLKEAENDG